VAPFGSVHLRELFLCVHF
jgi:hypothetical protein